MDDLLAFLPTLQKLIEQNKFEELETDTLELKPCPSTGQSWDERYKSACAFLNTRGGILVLGIKESGQGAERRYSATGYDPAIEEPIKRLSKDIFTDSEGRLLDLTEYLPPPEIIQFMDKRLLLCRIDALPADRRFVRFKGEAYKRVLTGDQKIKLAELNKHTEYLEETSHAKELQTLDGFGLGNVDLNKLNEYILQLNRLQKIENLKPTLEDAVPYLHRKRFLIDNKLSILGALVCGSYPGDLLGFRAHVHGYVRTTNTSSSIVQDKQDLIDNVLQLLESANAYVLRNIHSGVSSRLGGEVSAEYPDAVLRETINNAIAHRDYSIDKQIFITIFPGQRVEITNPGKFRDQLILNLPSTYRGQSPILRVLPETKPRNPKLADVLRVFRKWEGLGIGMSTLVNLCLGNKLELPYFKFKSDEVTLVLQSGSLLDSRINELFDSRDNYIATKLGSFAELDLPKKAVLAYLIKSEWANLDGKYAVQLTTDNNHHQAIKVLLSSGLITRDERSTELYPVYIADRNLVSDDYSEQLNELFGSAIDDLVLLDKQVLAVIYRYSKFNSKNAVNARQTVNALWQTELTVNTGDVHAFDLFTRNVRRSFNKLQQNTFIEKKSANAKDGFTLNTQFKGSQRGLF